MTDDFIDRKKLSEAFSYLASEKGEEALDLLNEGLEAFRSRIPNKLSDAEFKYLTSALTTQRSNDFKAEVAPLRSVSAAVNLRHGFTIKAKI